MKFTFYELYSGRSDLRPASASREWMDKTDRSFAYRCLPLNIANAHGWSFHLPFGLSARWDGTSGKEAIRFRTAGGEDISRVATSIFGHGIMTFFIPGLFRTEQGWDILASGPANLPKDGISPLQGIIETDWAPYSFTMNWKITRPDTWISFEKDEPFCTVCPVRHGHLQEIEPVIRPIDDNPELKNMHEEWSRARSQFVKDLKVQGSEAYEERWQKNYYQGKYFDGSEGPEDHIIKLRLNPFSAPQQED